MCMAWECLVVVASWSGECCQISRNQLSPLSKDKMGTMIICVHTTDKTVRSRRGRKKRHRRFSGRRAHEEERGVGEGISAI